MTIKRIIIETINDDVSSLDAMLTRLRSTGVHIRSSTNDQSQIATTILRPNDDDFDFLQSIGPINDNRIFDDHFDK